MAIERLSVDFISRAERYVVGQVRSRAGKERSDLIVFIVVERLGVGGRGEEPGEK